MTKKKTTWWFGATVVMLGLAAEAILPVAITSPFISRETAVLEKSRQQYVSDDFAHVINPLRDIRDSSSDPKQATATPAYRSALIRATRQVKTDLGAMVVSLMMIPYLADHPDDKEVQDEGLAMVDRGLEYENKTFTPIYEKLDRIYRIRELSFPIWLKRKEIHDLHTEARTLIPQALLKSREGILHPRAYMDAQQKEKDDLLKLANSTSKPTAKKP